MAGQTVPFFYDDQIRRFLIQFTRMFSNYQVVDGVDDTGAATLVRVPVRYGDASRQASQIIAQNLSLIHISEPTRPY